MTSPIEPRTASLYHASRAAVVEPWVAAAIVLTAMATYLVAPMFAPSALRFVVAQAALAAVTVVGVLVAHPARALAALGLRGARPVFFVAAVAIGATAWYLNLRLVALLPLPEGQARALQVMVDRPSLAGALLSFAALPAVCEELVFRGVLARSLGRNLAVVMAAAISAIVFSTYHLSLVQALPTLTLGFVLAVVAIRADSIAPTMLAHAINNAMALTMSRGEVAPVATWMDRHPTLALVGCGAATALGLMLAARGTRTS